MAGMLSILNFLLIVVGFRADYWKSNAKKYCDFCKCWITDNKPSVEFHERGRRHQENVAKRLKQITRTNARLDDEAAATSAALAQMEADAMRAYRRDIAAQHGDWSATNAGGGGNANKVWRAAHSERGIYYWNTLTNESVWEPPTEGYLSVEEVAALDAAEGRARRREVDAHERLQRQEACQEAEEVRARAARERMRERRADSPPPPPTPGPLLEEGRTNPYGRWQTVRVTEAPPTATCDDEEPSSEVHDESPLPPTIEFKEKTVEALTDIGGSSQFKKRKLKSTFQRSTRTRCDDD